MKTHTRHPASSAAKARRSDVAQVGRPFVEAEEDMDEMTSALYRAGKRHNGGLRTQSVPLEDPLDDWTDAEYDADRWLHDHGVDRDRLLES